jgi:hypothetical protein
MGGDLGRDATDDLERSREREAVRGGLPEGVGRRGRGGHAGGNLRGY